MFKIKILGCNGLFPYDGNNTSGYLLRDEKTSLVLDMGSGVFQSLLKEMPPEKVDGVYISHLHFDHISDLGVYNYYLERLNLMGKFKGRVKLFIKSSESAVYQSIEALKYFEIHNFDEKSEILLGDFNLSFLKLKHPEEDYGITVKRGRKAFSYLGDTNICENFYKIIKNSNVALIHAPFLKEEWNEGKAHLNLFDGLLCGKENNTMCICSHFLPFSNIDKLKEEACKTGANYIFAVQGEEYNID